MNELAPTGRQRHWRLHWCTLQCAAAGLLAGCTAGPQFVPPAAPPQTGYTGADPAVIPAGGRGEAQRVHAGAAVPQGWWQAFGSPALDAMVAQALVSSPTLESARAAVDQADALTAAARGAAYPQLTASASAARAGGASDRRNQFALGAGATFDPDLAGGIRRRVEQASALAAAQRAQWRSVRLSLIGAVLQQAVALAAAVEQISAADEIIAVDQRTLELVQVAVSAGKSAQLDLLTAQSLLANDRTLLPPLEQAASVARHALAVLTGRSPADWRPPQLNFAMLTLPRDLPLVLPSQMVRNHPDIQGAQAQLHAANAAVGVAAAQLYPSAVLSASWTRTGQTAGQLFSGGDSLANLAAALLAPVFNGGTLAAQRDAAIAAYAAQLGVYRETVLQVFGRIADALAALQYDAAQADAQGKALDSARAALLLTQESYQAGQASLLQLLASQRLFQQARLGEARATGQRYADTILLFVALGGDYGPAGSARDD